MKGVYSKQAECEKQKRVKVVFLGSATEIHFFKHFAQNKIKGRGQVFIYGVGT